MLEEPGHYERLPVRSNLAFFAHLYGASPEVVEELLVRVDLQDKACEPVSRLSRGMRQRLALARALVGGPSLLFLDEPTSGVDPVARRAFWDTIDVLAHDGATVFVSTHFMDEAEYCGRLGGPSPCHGHPGQPQA